MNVVRNLRVVTVVALLPALAVTALPTITHVSTALGAQTPVVIPVAKIVTEPARLSPPAYRATPRPRPPC